MRHQRCRWQFLERTVVWAMLMTLASIAWQGAGGDGNEGGQRMVAAASQANTVQEVQSKAASAIEAARARLNEAYWRLWTFDEERARQMLADAEAALARSYAASRTTGETDEDPEGLAWRAKSLAEAIFSIVVDSRAAEARGVWIDKDILSYLSTPDMLRGLIRRLAETNVNVLYVLAYDMGQTIYPSPYAVLQDPHFKDWEEDPLRVIVDEAHRHGMEVQAWMGVFVGGYGGKPGPLLTLHPDWADVTRSGKKVSRYGTLVVNPSLPQAQEHLLNIIGDIVQRYNVDGIQLDFARYEENGADDFGYHPYSVELFREQYGVDPHSIARGSALWRTWVKWRQDQVTGFVRRVRQRLQETRPGTLLSVAAEPIVEAAELRFQDWALWAREGIVDQVVPMDYVKDVAKFRQWAEANAAALRDARSTFWYEGIGQFTLADQELIERIELNRRLGADGTVLWSVVSMKMSTYQALKEGPWRLPAVLPTGREGATEAAIAALLGRLADRLEAVYTGAGPGGPVVAQLVERLREAARAAQPEPSGHEGKAWWEALQARVEELQALVNRLSSPGAADGTAGQGSLAPLTVEALNSELQYVHHLAKVGMNRQAALRAGGELPANPAGDGPDRE